MDGWNVEQLYNQYFSIRKYGKLQDVFKIDRHYDLNETARMLEEYKNTGDIKGLERLRIKT